MNVMKALITAIKMQLVTTLKEVSSALVTLDTQAMGLFAWVSVTDIQIHCITISCVQHSLVLVKISFYMHCIVHNIKRMHLNILTLPPTS